MKETTLIKNAELIQDNKIVKGDVLIENGKIRQIEQHLPEHAEEIINGKNLFLMPGIIDPHVHFRDPGVTWKEDLRTGSIAAVSGGVTSFFEMPNTNPSTISRERMSQKKKIASEKSIANYNFFIGATPDNLEECLNVENVPGIKIYVGSSTGSLLVDTSEILEPFFKYANKLIAVHSEEESMVNAGKEACLDSTDVLDHYKKIRTAEAAIKCTERLIALAKSFNTRLHICHLTTAEEAIIIEKEKISTRLTTEVSPQHLFLYGPDIYQKIGTYAQINPPIREEYHSKQLWQSLKNGTIDCIATDHAPHTCEEKEVPFGKAPSGMPGIDTSLALMLNQYKKGLCSLFEIQRWMCEKPTEIFGIQNKGKIRKGYDADLVLIDLDKKWKVDGKRSYSKAKWSAFEGYELNGRPLITLVNGNKVYQEGDIDESIKGKEVIISN